MIYKIIISPATLSKSTVQRSQPFIPFLINSTQFEQKYKSSPLSRPNKSATAVKNDSCCSLHRKRLFPRATKSKLPEER